MKKDKSISKDSVRKLTAKEWETTFDAITDLISIHDGDFRIVCRKHKPWLTPSVQYPKNWSVENATKLCMDRENPGVIVHTEKPLWEVPL